MTNARPIPQVFLYTKPGCKLCDQVKSALLKLASRYPHELTEVDITEDAVLFEQYRFNIPVITIGSRQLQAPITLAELETALK